MYKIHPGSKIRIRLCSPLMKGEKKLRERPTKKPAWMNEPSFLDKN
jgi:hypothetical protein